MKKFLIVFCLFCTTGFTSENILNFHSRIDVLDNGDIHVTETIDIKVENRNIRHGIYRDNPTVYLGAFLSHQKFNIIIVDVKLDGNDVNYTTERLMNGIRVKIGSKDYYVSKGVHQYKIEYLSKQQIKTFSGSEGIYWNVTGTGWMFPINKASVDIYFSNAGSFSILSQDAWTGSQGSAGKHYTSQIYNDHIHFETTKKLYQYQGLTVQATWPEGIITNPQSKTWSFIKNNFFWLASIILLSLYPWYFYKTWKKVGIDPPKDPIYPLFKPPNNISPAAMRFVREKHYDSKGFSIAIMNLAVKNFITIEQVSKKKYILTKQSVKSEKELSRGESAIYGHLFLRKNTITIKNEYNSRVKTASGILDSKITNEHQAAFYKDNKTLWKAGVFISLVALFIAWVHFFNLSSYALNYLYMPLFAIILSAGALSFTKKPIYKLIVSIIPVIILIGTILNQSNKVYIAYLVIICFIIILNALFYHLLQAPTVFGQKLLGKIEGFRMYLNTAEQDRLDLMHPPEMTPQLFEKYLPYALALGVENKWSEQFNNAMKIQDKEIGNYHPNWYIGNNYSNFDFASTASSIGAGLASSVISASTPPSSSGSSSGFGGGGFSGGGGGGGGGGGW
jgi:uncharacterized membrane protein YgcG